MEITAQSASRQASVLQSEITAEKRRIRTAREELRLKATRLKSLREQCERFGIELVVVPLDMGGPSSPGETAAIARDVAADL